MADDSNFEIGDAALHRLQRTGRRVVHFGEVAKVETPEAAAQERRGQIRSLIIRQMTELPGNPPFQMHRIRAGMQQLGAIVRFDEHAVAGAEQLDQRFRNMPEIGGHSESA